MSKGHLGSAHKTNQLTAKGSVPRPLGGRSVFGVAILGIGTVVLYLVLLDGSF